MSNLGSPSWELRLLRRVRGAFCWLLGHKWYGNSAGTWRVCGYCKKEETE